MGYIILRCSCLYCILDVVQEASLVFEQLQSLRHPQRLSGNKTGLVVTGVSNIYKSREENPESNIKHVILLIFPHFEHKSI